MFTETSLKKMDPAMSLSLINMKLRDQFSSLSDFANYYDLSELFISVLMTTNNWRYDEQSNQLKENG